MPLSTSDHPVADYPAAHSSFDYVLVGGGLQNALIALGLLHARPYARLAIVEPGLVGGNHTWCFHGGDVPESARSWVEPLVVQRWRQYHVSFPRRERRLESDYSAISSEQLRNVVMQKLSMAPHAQLLRAKASVVADDGVVLQDGQRLQAHLVVDSRGPQNDVGHPSAYQKFFGVEFEVAAGTAPTVPMLMDARVPQHGAFRFFYVLPLALDRVLVEDTYYSLDPELDTDSVRGAVHDYARSAGFDTTKVVREEQGVLPLPLRPPKHDHTSRVLTGGYAGGWLHPTTGYSFPLAVRLAEHVASRSPSEVFDHSFRRLVKYVERQQRYTCWLNRLLFHGFAPEQRYGVLERFYGLPEDTILRFYALQLSPADRLAILCGKPPAGFSPRQFLQHSLPPFSHHLLERRQHT